MPLKKEKYTKKDIQNINTFGVDVYKVTGDINSLQNTTTKNQLFICNLLLRLGMVWWLRPLQHFKSTKNCCYSTAFTKTKELVNNGKKIA